MGWNCTIKDKDGNDLLEKYGVNYRLLGLAPNCPDDTEARYRLSDIRSTLDNFMYKDSFPQAAQDAIRQIKSMLLTNLNSLKQIHCYTCQCEPEKPAGWSKDAIDKFLSIPLEEVHSIISSC